MGKFASKFSPNPELDEEEKQITKYEENLESNPYGYGLQDTEDLKTVSWWQRLIFDLRFRIAYALAVAILIGIGIPIAVHFIFYKTSDSTIYGSCLVKTEARFQCLLDNVNLVTREDCVEANCCWEENNDLQFKCFHSFPSAYQYKIIKIERGVEEPGVNQEEEEEDPLTNWVQLSVEPNQADRMSNLSVLLEWLSEDHLLLQISNADHYARKQVRNASRSDKATRSMDRRGIHVRFGEEMDYFFIQLVRNSTTHNETIFDTRLGPIISNTQETKPKFLSVSTTLATPYFYGPKGGEGIASRGTTTSFVVNSFQNSELPFYMSLEESGAWHSVLLDTTFPFITQVLQAPAIGFHVEGATALDLHFFFGPGKNETLIQLHSFLSEKVKGDFGNDTQIVPYIPEYWGLGLHLCRASANASEALKHLRELNGVNEFNQTFSTETALPYDSDCIDSNLRVPFGINYTSFPQDGLDMISSLLMDRQKKVVLTQRNVLQWVENQTDITEFEDFILKNTTTQLSPFIGMMDNLTVMYLDVFHPDIFTNLSLWGFDFGNISPDGFILADNYPKNEAVDPLFQPNSAIQKLFSSTSNVSFPFGEDKRNPWGTVSPNVRHNFMEKTHLELHNAYGVELTRKFRKIMASLVSGNEDDDNDKNFLLASSSAWTESLYFGGMGGMEVEKTWIGLRESLAHVVRQSFLRPVSGIMVCGSFLSHNLDTSLDSTLCLRSYQLALLMPYVYHDYAKGKASRGPLDLPTRYQDYLKEAIRQRYTYAPYYYTLLIEYQKTFVPMILPMSYEFHDARGVDTAATFKLTDQFMIGSSLLAAPIVKPDLNRETWFPPGIWYDSDGYVAWNDVGNGGFRVITGHLTQTPLFIRGGHIIPILENPKGHSIMESRQGNYTLMAALLLQSINQGKFYPEEGMNNSIPISSEIEFDITTFVTQTRIQINTTVSVIGRVCKDEGDQNRSSTIIDQVKYLGFPVQFNNVTSLVIQERPTTKLSYVLGDDIDYLRIGGIDFDWCTEGEDEIHITIEARQQT